MMPRTAMRMTPLEERLVVGFPVALEIGTHGTRPTIARTEGRERIPREMVSAIMTADMLLKPDI